MAVRLVSPARGLLVYGRGLRFLSQSSWRLKNEERDNPGKLEQEDVVEVIEGVTTVLPDPAAGLLGPSDYRLPLPGNVGLSQQLSRPSPPALGSTAPQTELPHILSSPLNYDRHVQVMYQYYNPFNSHEEAALSEEDLKQVAKSSADILEFSAKPCPQLLRKDLQDLFPGRSLADGTLTVVTVSQPTVEDGAVWSEAMEVEREELMEHFVAVARDVCGCLAAEGYWADFIDPSSGRPYLGPFTNASMFETDERYRHLGFQIEDLGCCKVIRHSVWGTRVFVGCLLTSAPVSSEALNFSLSRHQQKLQEN